LEQVRPYLFRLLGWLSELSSRNPCLIPFEIQYGIRSYFGSSTHRKTQQKKRIFKNVLFFLFAKNNSTSSSFGLITVDLLQSCFNLANEKHIIGVLFKLSTVSCLHNAFEVLTHIGVPLTGFHTDTFIMIIRRIVVSLH